MPSEPRSARSSKQSAAQSAATSHRLLLQEGMNGEPERGFLDRSKSHEDHPYVVEVVDATANCPRAAQSKSRQNLVQMAPNFATKAPGLLNAATQAGQSHVNCFDEGFTTLKWPLVDCVTWTLHGRAIQ